MMCPEHPSWHPDGKRLVYSHASSVFVVDPERNRLQEVMSSLGMCYLASWHPNRKEIAYGNYGKLNFCSVEGGEAIRTFDTHEHDFWALDWKSDGTQIATGAFDGRAKIVDPETGEVFRDFGHDSGVAAVSYSPDEKYLATGTSGQKIVVLGYRSAKPRT